MSKMKDLYEKVAADSALQAKFAEILCAAEKEVKETTKAKLIAFAKEAGFEVTVEEMTDFFQKLSEAQETQLSDSELDQVAGGKNNSCTVGFSVITAGISCAVLSLHAELSGSECKKVFELY